MFRNFRIVEEPERPRRRCPVDADDPGSDGGENPTDGRGPLTWWRQWHDEQGYVNLDARLDPTCGAELTAAIDATAAALRADQHDDSGSDAPEDGRRVPVSRVEAVGELAAAALVGLPARGFRPRSGERFAVHVSVDAAALTGDGPGAGVLEGGQRVDANLVRSWLPASTIDLLLHDRGRPLRLSRSRRVASPAQRRALKLRDHGCAYHGCGQTRFVDAHHITPWEQGGRTDIDNLVLLCRRHHRLLHTGDYSITTADGHPQFHHPDGTPITRRHATPPPPPLRPAPQPPPTPRHGDPLTTYALDIYLEHLLE